MHIDDFEKNCDQTILARGRAYWRDGYVCQLEEVAPNLYHAFVDGAQRYDVDIRVRDGEVVTHACSCPYAARPICKHVVAVLLEMRRQKLMHEGEQGDMGKRGEGEHQQGPIVSHDVYERVCDYFLKYEPSSRNPNANYRPLPKVRRGDAMGLGAARDVISLDFWRVDDYERWSHWGVGSEVFRGVYEVLDNAAHARDVLQAAELALLAATLTGTYLYEVDDSSGNGGDALEESLAVLSLLCDDLAGDHDARYLVTERLLGALISDWASAWCFEEQIVEMAVRTACDEHQQLVVLDQLHRLRGVGEGSSYRDEQLVPLEYDLLCAMGRTKDADALRKKHAGISRFLDAELAQAFVDHDMRRVLTLLDQRGSTTPAFGVRASLPSDVFPDGYDTVREAALQELCDVDNLRALYRERVERGVGAHAEEALAHLRRLSAEDWPHERDTLVKRLLKGTWPSALLEQLMIDDNLTQTALAYCKKHPERVVRLGSLLAQDYPGEVRSTYRDLIDQKSRYTSGRETYREICKLIQRYQAIFGFEEARGIVDDLLRRYPRRRAMVEELSNLEKSWEL